VEASTTVLIVLEIELIHQLVTVQQITTITAKRKSNASFVLPSVKLARTAPKYV
jgi:hypothetical protein